MLLGLSSGGPLDRDLVVVPARDELIHHVAGTVVLETASGGSDVDDLVALDDAETVIVEQDELHVCPQ